VLAVLTHYRCEPWLAQAIESLLCQSRPLDGVVVIDDASEQPPVEIVGRFPQVTLLAAAEQVGPYHLIQAVIDRAHCDAFLMQDADDWSGVDRLAVQLAEAERSGAELIGTASLNIEGAGDSESRQRKSHPRDVNRACARWPGEWFLSWGTALVGRDLVLRLGGLATGLRFSGDVEFANRAHHVAKVVNVAECCYYRRKRPDGLSSARDTGKGSPVRVTLRAEIRSRALENAEDVIAGRAPNLAPLAVAPPVEIRHLAGPGLPRGPAARMQAIDHQARRHQPRQ
jgi:hypothetical protein